MQPPAWPSAPQGAAFFPNPARPGPSPALFGPFFGPSLAHSVPGGRHPVRRRGRAGVASHEGRALFLMPWRGEGYRHGHDRGAAVEAFHRHRTRGQWQNAQHPGYGPWPCHRRVFASSMGGAIEAEIAPGQGSSFHVVLIFWITCRAGRLPGSRLRLERNRSRCQEVRPSTGVLWPQRAWPQEAWERPCRRLRKGGASFLGLSSQDKEALRLFQSMKLACSCPAATDLFKAECGADPCRHPCAGPWDARRQSGNLTCGRI